MRVVIFRSPESEGRPEKFIADAIVQQLQSIAIEVVQVKVPEKAPENSSDFYSPSGIPDMFTAYAEGLALLKEGDIAFVMDAQTPLPAMLDYYRNITGLSIRITGLFHSSSFTDGDLFYKKQGAVAQEIATLKILDVVIAATGYLADALWDLEPSANIEITGLPVSHVPTDSTNTAIKGTVCWPHRMAEDKNLALYEEVVKSRPDLDFYILSPVPVDSHLKVVVCPTKADYFKALQSSQIVLSTATLETFGYAVIEGVMCGCVPVMPRSACYPDIYSGIFYNEYSVISISHALDKALAYEGKPLDLVTIDPDAQVTIARAILSCAPAL